MKESKILQYYLIEMLDLNKERTAIQYGGKQQTYEELDQKTNYISNWIYNKDIKKGTFIGIMVENREALINAIIGILKAGCVFVPLDISLPDGRLKEMIRTVNVKHIITDNLNISRTSDDSTVNYFTMDDILSPAHDTWFSNSPDIQYAPEDQIYLYFTSGTTGKPKGIIGKNKSLLHFINWEIETFNINGTSKVSQFIAPGFDAILRDIFVPLLSGGICCIPPDPEIK